MKNLISIILLFCFVYGCNSDKNLKSTEKTIDKSYKISMNKNKEEMLYIIWLHIEDKLAENIKGEMEIPTRSFVNCKDLFMYDVDLPDNINGEYFTFFDLYDDKVRTKTIYVRSQWISRGCEEVYLCSQTYHVTILGLQETFYKVITGEDIKFNDNKYINYLESGPLRCVVKRINNN